MTKSKPKVTSMNFDEKEKEIISKALAHFATEVNQERLNHSFNKDAESYNQSVITLITIQRLMNSFSDKGERVYHDIIQYGEELFFQRNNTTV